MLQSPKKARTTEEARRSNGDLSAAATDGLKLVFGTTKKTDPIDGPAYRIKAVKPGLIELCEPIRHIAGAASITVKRLKLIRECEYVYVQHIEVHPEPTL